jgi:competence protein ComEA
MGSVRDNVAAVSEEYRPVARQRLARVLTTPPSDHDRAEPDDPAAPPPAGTVARLAGNAFDPGRRGLRALAVVAVVVLLGAAVLAWWSRPRPEPVVMPQMTPVVAGTAGPAGPAATEPAELVVAVSGEVREPGLVHLPPGARVADAIEAAGGLLPGADVDHLNLARKVTDGELITVGIPPPPETTGGAPDAGTGGKVNLNTATLDQLQTLPGIGPALAQRIVDYRTANGPFTSVGQLRDVSGIGEVRFAELQDLVTV